MRLIIIYAALGWRATMPSHHATLRSLYIDHHGWLNTWLRSKLGNAADAADLAQDTFVRLLNRHELLELKAPRAFLRTVAKGIVIDHWRREELERAYLEAIAHLPCNESPSPESRELVFELLESIAKMLDGLAPRRLPTNTDPCRSELARDSIFWSTNLSHELTLIASKLTPTEKHLSSVGYFIFN